MQAAELTTSRDPFPQPGIAFSLDLIETTGKYGVNEVLLSSTSKDLPSLSQSSKC